MVVTPLVVSESSAGLQQQSHNGESVQPVIHCPTGGRHTRIILPQPVMGEVCCNAQPDGWA
ncbi:MAG: hypothetical protein ACE1Z0_08755, partial [Acidimicrobiia bacterium]